MPFLFPVLCSDALWSVGVGEGETALVCETTRSWNRPRLALKWTRMYEGIVPGRTDCANKELPGLMAFI